MAQTLFGKMWDSHRVASIDKGFDLLYVDLHLVHEVTSYRAFESLRRSQRGIRRPDLTVAVEDHIVATTPGRDELSYPEGTALISGLRRNCADFGIPLLGMGDDAQGIVHVIGPESGLVLPGSLVACGDSHTCTNGGMGALGLGIGTTQVGRILATQTVPMMRPKTMRVTIRNRLANQVTVKDVALHLIGKLGAGGGRGYAVEYAGEAVRSLSVEGRLTLCNMSVEWGARTGMVAPDGITFDYLQGRPASPSGEDWDAALQYWRTLPSDVDAVFDREVELDASSIGPQVTWGTNPEDVMDIRDVVPDPTQERNEDRRAHMERALDYMGLQPGQRLEGLRVAQVFIGSCTNARIEDLRSAAAAIRGRHVAPWVRAMVVPGSTATKQQAEAEGLHELFSDAGFEWHESGCSMCAAVNADKVEPGDRCVSTSNRNYEGRQGRAARTHLASPDSAVAAAVHGEIRYDPAPQSTS